MHLVTSNESDGASTHDFLSAPLTPSTAINNIEEMIDIETHEIVKVKTVPEEDNSFKPNGMLYSSTWVT
jgi:hypothetical protein